MIFLHHSRSDGLYAIASNVVCTTVSATAYTIYVHRTRYLNSIVHINTLKFNFSCTCTYFIAFVVITYYYIHYHYIERMNNKTTGVYCVFNFVWFSFSFRASEIKSITNMYDEADISMWYIMVTFKCFNR